MWCQGRRQKYANSNFAINSLSLRSAHAFAGKRGVTRYHIPQTAKRRICGLVRGSKKVKDVACEMSFFVSIYRSHTEEQVCLLVAGLELCARFWVTCDVAKTLFVPLLNLAWQCRI